MEVKVFGMENCAGCTTVKNVLNSKGVEYTDLDVNDVDNMELAMSYGVRTVPTTVINIDGVEHVFTGGSKQTVDSIKLHLGWL